MKSTTQKSDNADSTMHIRVVLRDRFVLVPRDEKLTWVEIIHLLYVIH
jgi:hypothetical protein